MMRRGWPFAHAPNTQFRLNRASPQARGLQAWWPSIGNSGSFVLRDYAGNGNDAASTVAVARVAHGRMGVGIDYTAAVNGYNAGTLTQSIANSAWAFAAWIAPDAFSADTIFNVGNGFSNNTTLHVRLESSTTVRLGLYFNDMDATVPNMTNQLVHVVAMMDSANVQSIYTDGIFRNSRNATSAYTGNATFNIGALASGDRYDGRMFDARLYNRALSAGEILHLYQYPYDLYQSIPRIWPVGFVAAASGGGSTYEMSATLTSISDTNAPSLHVLRASSGTLAGVSNTNDPALQVVRLLASTFTANSNASDASLLAIRQLTAILTAQSSTTDAALQVIRQLTATLTAISNTSDATLQVIRTLAATLTAISDTTGIELVTAGIIEMAATLTAQSQTTDAALQMVRSLVATLTAISSTADIALLVSGLLEMAATLTAQSATSDTALQVMRALSATLTAQSTTGNAVLNGLLQGAATLTAQSNTGNSALVVARSALATLTAQSDSDEAALQVVRSLAATLTAQSSTTDILIVTTIIEGLIRATFAARTPGSTFTATKPGATFER